MTREARKSDGTGFNWIVYADGGMAKESVGARVPEAIAEQVIEYAETHDITRTDAIELFIRTGLDDPERFERKRSYTVKIRTTDRLARDEPMWKGGWRAQLHGADRVPGEWESTDALTARLPRDVVQGIEEWAESHDMAKTVAAADLLKRGLWADPLPEGWEDPMIADPEMDGEVKTIELDPDEADLFRRCRQYYRRGPSEAVNRLVAASYSTTDARVGWAKPDEIES